jgi:SAM-dependent methyltransferase
MVTIQTYRQAALNEWNEKASAYDLYAGKITAQVAEPLLDATAVAPGMQVLDVATGPGYIAGAAQRRGAIATGIDIASAMIAQAKSNYPDALFYQGNAESMVFPDGFFDVVVCPFGLSYLSNPEKAVSAAHRVLRLGGNYAFTVWAAPEKNDFFNLVNTGIDIYGRATLPFPDAPSYFRFSDGDECRNILTSCGFSSIKVNEIIINWQPDEPDDVLKILYKSSVNTAMLLRLQEPEVVEQIHRHVLEGAHRIIVEKTKFNWPVVMAVACKEQ